jgi:hypothetical protein
MNDIHGAHSTTSIIENPLLLQIQIRAHGVDGGQLRHDTLDDDGGFVPGGGGPARVRVRERRLLHGAQLLRGENVEGF